MSKFEQKWWVVGLLAMFSTMSTRYVMDMAGIASPSGVAQFILYGFCFMGFWRIFACLGWFSVVLAAPRSKLLD